MILSPDPLLQDLRRQRVPAWFRPITVLPTIFTTVASDSCQILPADPSTWHLIPFSRSSPDSRDFDTDSSRSATHIAASGEP